MYIPFWNRTSRLQLQAFIIMVLLGVLTHAGATPTARDDLWVTNGTVYSSVTYGNNTGYSTGSGVGLDTVSGLLDTTFPKVAGTVNVVIANGAEGWYIGGNFTSAGGVARNNIARINADKTVDADWDPDANGAIHAILLSGTTLVVGGEFTAIGGVPRNRLAALITTLDTGFVTDWNPDADGPVLTMALLQTTLYAGGQFTHIGGMARNHIAAVDANLDEDGNTVITGWDPDANNFVRSLLLSADGETVYAGGDFTAIGGLSRNRIAAIDAGTDTNNAILMPMAVCASSCCQATSSMPVVILPISAARIAILLPHSIHCSISTTPPGGIQMPMASFVPCCWIIPLYMQAEILLPLVVKTAII